MNHDSSNWSPWVSHTVRPQYEAPKKQITKSNRPDLGSPLGPGYPGASGAWSLDNTRGQTEDGPPFATH